VRNEHRSIDRTINPTIAYLRSYRTGPRFPVSSLLADATGENRSLACSLLQSGYRSVRGNSSCCHCFDHERSSALTPPLYLSGPFLSPVDDLGQKSTFLGTSLVAPVGQRSASSSRKDSSSFFLSLDGDVNPLHCSFTRVEDTLSTSPSQNPCIS